jgi:hypothetical protein
MIKKYLTVIYILIIYKGIFSNPLDALYINYGSSQVLYSYCSLIPSQFFYPSSGDLLFTSEEKKIEFSYASLFSFGKNGFACGYKKNYIGNDIITAGYGLNSKIFSFGSSINVVVIKDNPLANLNLSTCLKIKNYIKNVIFSVNDISMVENQLFHPEVNISLTGNIVEKPDLEYVVSFRSIIDTNLVVQAPFFAKADITGRIGLKTVFLYSLGYQLGYTKSDASNSINFSMGTIASILDNGVGLFFGYGYNLDKKVNTIQCNLNFNPFQFRDVTAPYVSMNLTCSESEQPGYYFSLKANDNSNGDGLKSWTLVISDNPSKNSKIIKIFSGGSNIPSTIFWDLKSSEGIFMDSKTLYSRFICIDKSDNTGYTDWITLKFCNNFKNQIKS